MILTQIQRVSHRAIAVVVAVAAVVASQMALKAIAVQPTLMRMTPKALMTKQLQMPMEQLIAVAAVVARAEMESHRVK
jgi:hypothetical protein